MSSVVIAGDTSGSVTLAAPAVAGTTTLTLPTTNGTIITTGSTTGLDASAISSGTMATARLASGTANSGTYLRGDQTWASISTNSMTLLGTVTATSGNSVSLGSLDLTSYKYLYIVSNGLTCNTASANCYISSTNVNTTMGIQCSFSGTVGQISYGALIWDLTTGFSEQQGYGWYATSSTYDSARTNLTTASTTIYFRLSGTATFTGTGSFIVYGVK